jgi:predicted metal-dependent HD superfamily phosphohydrolase
MMALEPSQDSEVLLPHWRQLCSRLSIIGEGGETIFQDLCHCYSEPGRYYHTLEHLASMFQLLADLRLSEVMEPALQLAVWYHDAVYDSRAADNEERSAALARSQLTELHLPAGLIEETVRLILLTKSHTATAEDHLGRLLLDADLAILGAAPDAYDRYAAAIRQEYAWVSEEAYRKGRADVLRRFLERPRIYCTNALHDRCEQQARHNLNRELASRG